MFSADLGGYTPPPVDATNPPFNKVALLLHGDGTNGAQNNTFVDSSTNNFTITRTGNVAQGTFSPFSLAEGQWSNYFDGSGDYLSAPNSTSLQVLGSAFTIECWFYLTATSPSDMGLISQYQSDGSGYILRLLSTGTGIRWYAGTGGQVLMDRTYAFALNTWYHVAVTCDGTNTAIFVNGVKQGASGGVASANSTATFQVGLTHTSTNYFTGYISNVRVVKGTDVYGVGNSSFTVPTSPLTAITNTSLLTCQSNRFKDNSSNNFIITPAGDTKVTAWSPFIPALTPYSTSTNGGSGYFDGSGDYLQAPSSTSLDITTTGSPFTIEAWIYPITLPSITPIAMQDNGSSARCFQYRIDNTGSSQFIYFTSGGAVTVTATQKVIAGQWNHVAVSYTGTTLHTYVNGVGNSASVSSMIGSGSVTQFGGHSTFAVWGNCYLTDSRIVKGTALYTSNFTPPTAPLTAVANTQLLLNCTNAGIIDNAGKNDIETVGNAQVSTSVKKYGTGSMYFDGTGDYLTFQNKQIGDFGTGDFTAELWIYAASTSTSNMVDFRGNVGTGSALRIAFNAGKIWAGWINDDQLTSLNTLSTNTWYHIAVTRSGSTARLFINGVLNRTVTDSSSIIDNGLVIGSYRYGFSALYNGYIDDLRITKGQALYTSNFTPPTQAFPNV